MALKLSLILKAIDKMSGPTRKAAGNYTFMEKAIAKASGTSLKLSRSQEHLERRLRRNKQLAKGYFFKAIGQSADRVGQKIRKFTRDLKLNERALKMAGKAGSWAGGKLKSMIKYGALAATAAGGYAIFDMFRVASDFEQFQIMLEGTEGSAKKAEAAMKWVQDFASSTPYELNDVMAAYVQLRAYGIDPTTGALRSLGDAASGMNKGLMQAVEALADAQTGEFERLKEFAIKTKTVGDKVTFSYIKNGKTLTKSVKKDAAQIQAALTGIFDERFGGGMARQSKTLKGLMSNLKDQWAKFQLMVANAGIFDRVKAGAERLLAKVQELADDGRLQRWATNISKFLEKAWNMGEKFVENTDWKQVGSDLKSIGKAAWTIAMAIARAVEAGERFSKIKWAFPLSPAGALGYSLFGGGDEKKAPPPAVRKPRKPPPPITPNSYLRGTNRNLLKSPAARGAYDRSPRDVKVSGRTEVEIRIPANATAKVRKLSSQGSDVPMAVSLGKSNGLAA